MSSVRIRMYRQGLGDCFLLTFPGQGGEAHVLIDCGVLLGTQDGDAKVRKVAQHILDATSGRVAALVVTHEHWDHVSGFAQAQDLFGQLQPQEVWLAWTEKPGDPLAAELDKRRAKALNGVVSASQRLAGMTGLAAQRTKERLDGILQFWGGFAAAGRKTTRTAMDWVRSRAAAARPCFLEPGMTPFSIPGVDGVRVYVLGPPRDPKLLRKSDPSKRASEVYELAGEAGVDLGFFAAIESLAQGGEAGAQPFEEWFRVRETEATGREFFQDHYGFADDDWRRIEHDWLGVAGRLALQLDSDTNNTSLVLAFELQESGRVLLFPGDAQVGNWLSWQGLEWKLEEGGRTRMVTTADLFSRTVLYKVGHHGSHNATLREQGLELMSSDELAAMLPVERGMAAKMKWSMPFPGLFRRLEERTKGRILDLERGQPAERPDALSEREWELFKTQAAVEQDWVDYHVAL